MSTYTIVTSVRQHFGDDPNTFSQFPFGPVIDDVVGGVAHSSAGSAPFVGAQKDYDFSCPNVDPRQTAVLLFQSLGVQHEGNRIAVNPEDVQQPSVFGGIPVVPAQAGNLPTWTANVLLIGPGSLKEEGNILRIESRPLAGEQSRELDDFVVDNIIIQYKTLRDPSGRRGRSVFARE